MTTTGGKRRTLFLNGVECDALDPTGNAAKDLMAARKFLAEKGVGRPQGRVTLRDKLARAWRRRI